MRFSKGKVLWLTIYAIAVTGVFLYLLFPSQVVKQQLETVANSAGLILKAGTLRPSLPLGIKLKDVTVRSAQAPADVLFQGELMDMQFNPVSFFRKNKTIHFKGRAYGGRFDGRAGLLSFDQINPPAEGRINFQDIDLARYDPAGFPFFKGMTGLARGSAFNIIDDPASRNPVGKISLFLSRGSYPLPEPFLGLSRLEFDGGEIQAQWQNGSVTLEKFEIYGTQMKCSLKGDIQIAHRVDESRLNLTGVLEMAGKNKIKMTVTVSGTLAGPSFRYI